jgi:NAD(P)-dependent dehydrogenase (short-subunit alcohol dehydrogenase family)
MRRKGFKPYGPSKAALESASMIWAQDLAGTGKRITATQWSLTDPKMDDAGIGAS